MDGAQLRAGSARALNQVLGVNRTSDWVLENRPGWLAHPLAREYFYGCLRHVYTLRAAIDEHLKRPVRERDFDVYCLMLVGAYQLKYAHVSMHAALNETVNACAALAKPWAKALVNGVLRAVSRSPATPDRSFDHPSWMVRMLRDAWPDDWRQLLHANNERAPMALRINTTRIDPRGYRKRLLAAGQSFQDTALPEAVILDKPCRSEQLPGWRAGEVAIQDYGAQLATHVLWTQMRDAADPVRLLDACAAPGGKLMHLAELLRHGNRDFSAQGLDSSERRLTAMRESAQRLGHQLTLQLGDATRDDWWSERPYSHILVDAPCSGSGTIRRHPDIKVLLQRSDVAAHAERQLAMLNNLWRMLAGGGTLLYCTCSVFAMENDQVIERFIEHNSDADNDAHVTAIDLPTGLATSFGWQLLPTDPRTDGFYVALLRKSRLGSASR